MFRARWREHFLAGMADVEGRLDSNWPQGRRPDAVPGSGGNFSLPGFSRPVSVDRIEGRFLYNLAVQLQARVALEIGTGFGYSTLWLAGGVL